MNQTFLSGLFQEDLYQYTTPLIVVLSRVWCEYNEEERNLLNKILTSVKIDLNTVHTITQPSLNLQALLPFSPKKVLVFGSLTDGEIPLYQTTAAHGLIIIRADDLSHMDEGKKKNLWIALRQVFGV